MDVIERRYVDEVGRALGSLPARDFDRLMGEVEEHLSERPKVESWEALIDGLGEPSAYADELRARAGLSDEASMLQRVLGQRRPWLVVEVVLAITVVGGGIVAWAWYSAVPHIWNACGAVWASEVEQIEAAGERESIVAWREQERLGVGLCPMSHSDIVIENVSFAAPLASIVQPVGVELAVPHRDPTFIGDVSVFAPYQPEVRAAPEVVLWLEFDLCGSVDGGTVSFDRVDVDYLYRGRSRTTTVELLSRVSISEPDRCPGVGENDDRRSVLDGEQARWDDAFDTPISGPIGPLGLYPENLGRDLCRYLRGVNPNTPYGSGLRESGAIEPLEARAVFQLDNDEIAVAIVDAALAAICPQFTERRDELVKIIQQTPPN